MENNSKEKAQREQTEIKDAYNDDHWQKKYGVSADELKSTHDIGIAATIINVTSKNNGRYA